MTDEAHKDEIEVVLTAFTKCKDEIGILCITLHAIESLPI